MTVSKKPNSSILITSKIDPAAIKPSVGSSHRDKSAEVLNVRVRQFSKMEISISKQDILGRGVFGKCFLGTIGPIKVCIKVLKGTGSDFRGWFYREANMLCCCCHPNVCYLFGVCQESKHNMIITSFHGINFQSHSLHSVLFRNESMMPDVASLPWKNIVIGIISGIDYIHSKAIIHNDLKEDNIVLESDPNEQFKAVIIDFGKACFDAFGKKYALTHEEKELYKSKHPHIAPDLRNGIRAQDKLSDIFSTGRVLSIVCEKVLPIPGLSSITELCLKYNALERPNTEDLFTSLKNLLV